MNKLSDKYQIVTGIHGNEKVPVLALASVGVEQTVANSAALALGKRFIEKDMNSAFGTGGMTLEEIAASKLLNKLDQRRKVIDLHTTTGVDEPFAIIVDKSQADFAAGLGLNKIVMMKFNIKGGHALINYRSGVSVECGVHDTKTAFDNAVLLISRLIEGPKMIKPVYYEVYGTIEKPGVYTNFVQHEAGFVPVFAMKNSYNNFGLMTRIVKKEEL